MSVPLANVRPVRVPHTNRAKASHQGLFLDEGGNHAVTNSGIYCLQSDDVSDVAHTEKTSLVNFSSTTRDKSRGQYCT